MAMSMLLCFVSAVLPYWRAISMLLVLTSAVSAHWSANMLLIKWKVISAIPSERIPVCCHCVVKSWYAIMKQSVTTLAAMQHLHFQ